MSNQTFENEPDNRYETKKNNLKNEIRSLWLGRKDSNSELRLTKP
jgi:hypothetical protein